MAGKWKSPTSVDCLRPQNLSSADPYQVALIPGGLHRVIRFYENAYFDFYEPCIPTNCLGVCLQNICVCKHGKSGNSCNENIQLSEPQCSDNQTQSYNATESETLSALVVSNVTRLL